MRAFLRLCFLFSSYISLPALRISPSSKESGLEQESVELHSKPLALLSMLEREEEELGSFQRRQVLTFNPSRVAGAVKDSYILTVALDLYRSMLEREGACSGHHGRQPLLAPTFSSVLLSRDGVYCAEGPAEKLPLEYWSGEALQALTEGRRADLVANSLYALGVLLYKLKHGEHEHPFGIVPGMDLGMASGNLRRLEEPIKDGSSLLELVIRSALRKERGGLAVLLELASGNSEGFVSSKDLEVYAEVTIVEDKVRSVGSRVLPLPAAAGLLSSSYLLEVAKSVALLISKEAKRGKLFIPTLSSVSLTPNKVEVEWQRSVTISVDYLSREALLNRIDGLHPSLYPQSSPFFALGVLLSKLENGVHFHPSGVTPEMSAREAFHVLTSTPPLKRAAKKGCSSVQVLIDDLVLKRIQSAAALQSRIEGLEANSNMKPCGLPTIGEE